MLCLKGIPFMLDCLLTAHLKHILFSWLRRLVSTNCAPNMVEPDWLLLVASGVPLYSSHFIFKTPPNKQKKNHRNCIKINSTTGNIYFKIDVNLLTWAKPLPVVTKCRCSNLHSDYRQLLAGVTADTFTRFLHNSFY